MGAIYSVFPKDSIYPSLLTPLDFLQKYHLTVDVSNNKLTASIDPERCKRDLVNKHDGLEVGFTLRSDQQTDNSLLQHYKNRFLEVFDATPRSKTILHSVEATVEVSHNKIVHSKARRLGPDKFIALKTEINRLLEAGIIKPSHSEFSSPVVLVAKENGSFRMCADFTNLNKILRIHKYTPPNVQDFVNLAHGCKYFTTLDIKDAYYSIPVRPADKHMLTIATPLGNFQYNFLPMGLATSSCYYQRLMNEVVAGLPNVFAYLDDIIAMSQTKEQHAQLLDKLFERLKVHGLVVNETKCVFCVSSLIFLGHKVSEDGIAPSEEKAKTITQFQQPPTVKEQRRYLGMYQYYAKFVKHSSQWLQPLHALVNSTPRNQSLRWTTELTNCFIQSKTALSHATQLAFPDITAATELVVDASGTHIGAVLQQVKDDSCAALAFWSKALTPAQRAWSTFDREFFACFAAIRYFQYYLDAKDFTLRSDHKPLVHKFHSSTLSASPRQQRYLDYIAQFTNKFEYVKGKHNIADAISRPNNHIADLNNVLPTTKGLDYLRLALAQRVDNKPQ